jgi:hypothetical protein
MTIANIRFMSPLDAKKPAGIMATSLGKGKKVLSKNIIINIPKYPNCSTNSTIFIAISCNITLP